MEQVEKNKSELQREFELERVILFSDAVFAIAITLLVLDLKYKENTGAGSPLDWESIFEPLLPSFISFIVSFFFIGVQWSKHIEHMRYVRQYDKRFIMLNLIFLFFIVLFPFTASFLSKTKPANQLPYLVVYLGDIVFCTLAFYVLSLYIFKMKPALCFPGNEKEKNILLKKNLVNFITITLLGIGIVSISLIRNSDLLRFVLVALLALSIRFVRKLVNKKMAV